MKLGRLVSSLLVLVLLTGLLTPLAGAQGGGQTADTVQGPTLDQLQKQLATGQITAKEFDRLAPVQSCSPEAAWPGPDGFGYAGATATFNWVDITATGTAIVGLSDDNAIGPLAIGFPFNFYGVDQTEFYAGSNGFLTFGSGSTSLSNQCPLPSASTPDNLIAMLWDDLNFGTSGSAYYQTFNPCPVGTGQCTVVEYYNVAHYGGGAGSAGTWEAILFESGDIMIQFLDSGTELGLESTTGIEGANFAADYGLTYACNVANSIPDNLAILFTMAPPTPRYDESSKGAPAAVVVGEPINYTITIRNTGDAPGMDTTMTDPIPAGTTYNGDVACSSGVCSFDGSQVVWNGQVAPPLPPKAAAAPVAAGKASSAGRPIELSLSNGPVMDAVAPWQPDGAVSLILDDGSRDNDIGIGGTWEFLWLNRFTPNAGDFPFYIDEVAVYFSSIGMVNVGDDMILALYENTSGNADPAVGANYLASFPVTVQALDAWNVYTLPSQVTFNGPGDALVGVVALETPGTSYWPASMDQTVSQQRSWAGWYLSSPPPNPPTLPPDDTWILIDAYFPGNWMVRASGETSGQVPGDVTVTFSVTPDNPQCGDTIFNQATIVDPAALGPVTVEAATNLVGAILYAEGFEATNGGYQSVGANPWTWGPPPANLAPAHSGVNVWATESPYGYSADYQLVSPWIDLSGANPTKDLVLDWWQMLDVEAGYDYAYVEVSTDGANWTTVWTGNYRGAWENKAADITDFIGQTVMLRFRMTSDPSVSYNGWAIDDVSIHEGCQTFLYPDITVDPAQLDAALCPDEQQTQSLEICNVGDAPLDWNLSELVPNKGIQAVLWDNGPLVTHPGGGFGGGDASALQTALGMTIYGFGNQLSAGNHMADDFTITDPAGWDVQQVTFFGYQTGAPASPSPIAGVYYQIWDGPPNDPASSIVFGDMVTNRLTGSAFSNIYRVLDTDMFNADRKVFTEVASAGVVLPPGTYWLDWITDGSTSYSGPWAPPISILGQTTTGNAMQYTTAGGWAAAVDGTYQQGIPFVVEGEIAGPPPDLPWLSEDPTSGTVLPGECATVAVTFDSTGLVPGFYTGALKIMSNDPDEPRIDVPVSLEVLTCGGNTMHVGDITGNFAIDPYGRTVLKMKALVHDQAEAPLGYVAVDASITFPGGGPVQRTRMTKLNGVARFHWGSSQSGGWQLCVDNLTKTDYVYVPGDNEITCQTWNY